MAPQVGLEPTTTRLTAECSAIELLRIIGGVGSPRARLARRRLRQPFTPVGLPRFSFSLSLLPYMTLEKLFRSSNISLLDPGDVLLSRAVASQVPSALRGLTSVFGMGTGGSLSLLSPEIFWALPHPHNRTDRAPQYEFLLFASLSLPRPSSLPRSLSLTSPLLSRFRSRASLRLSPRPISIIKLHTLPHFHR